MLYALPDLHLPGHIPRAVPEDRPDEAVPAYTALVPALAQVLVLVHVPAPVPEAEEPDARPRISIIRILS